MKRVTAETEAKLTLHPARMMTTSMNNKRSISTCYRYRINRSQQTSNYGLVDRGANGVYCRSEDTNLISLNQNQYCFVEMALKNSMQGNAQSGRLDW
jgi:hypothetical protein